MRIVRKFLERLEARPHSLAGLLIACGFTGIFRAMEEYLFFGEKLTAAMGVSMVFAYFHLAIALIVILHYVTKVDWKRIQNAVYIGIFLGIVPPLIDFGISGFNGQIIYRYYLNETFANLPWHFYDPALGAPAGETIVVWISILFTAGYAFLRTNSVIKFLITLAVTYLLMLLHFSFIPILAIKLAGQTPEGMTTQQTAAMANLTLSLMPFWYLFLSIIIFLILRPILRKIMIKRVLHLAPYTLVTLCGGQFTAGITTPVILAASSVFLVAFCVALQNDYFDSRHGEHRKIIEKSDMDFFNIMAAGFLLWMLILNQITVLPLIIIFSLGVLYNFPLFRIKKFFPGAQKIEGLGAAMFFMTGVMVFDRSHFRPQIFLIALLIFGGWSVLASWKDLKDIRSDVRLGYKNLYTFIMGFGVSLSKAHKISSLIGLACIVVPIVYGLLTGQYLAAAVIFGAGLLPLTALTYVPTIRKWFKYVLMGICAVLVECMVFLKFG